jgi:hypothetical protein
MHLIKFINKLINHGSATGQQIVEYEILSEAQGAFYEFVEDSLTVNEIKRMYGGGIPAYLNHL